MIPASDVELTPIAGFDPNRENAGYYFDPVKAKRALEFFPQVLTHTKSSKYTKAGEPFELAEYQKHITSLIYGCVDENGKRRFRTVYVEVARKNGKTTFVAGLALYELFAMGVGGAECYCAASSRDQASLLFDIAASMTRNSKTLKTESDIRKSLKRIIYKDSFLRAIPSDAHTAHGFNSSLVVIDELHCIRGRDFYDAMVTSTGARAEPLIVMITTAGNDRTSICWEVREYARKVRDGVINDPTFLPIIYGAEPGDDWKSPETWRKANPNLGVSVSEEYLQQQCNRAIAEPSYLNTFLTLHCGIWTEQETRWLSPVDWEACLV